jgi:hypothetical protein
VYDLTRNQIVFAVLMVLAAALMVLVHWTASDVNCFWDTSTCARSVEKDGVYEGTLQTDDGQLYRSSEFEVRFGSREQEPKVSFQTDENGSYCIVWAEDSYASATTPGGESLSGLGSWRDLGDRDPPPGCQESDEGVPWQNTEELESTWQFWLLIILPIAAIIVLGWGLVVRRTDRALAVFSAGTLLFVVNLLAFLVLYRFF